MRGSSVMGILAKFLVATVIICCSTLSASEDSVLVVGILGKKAIVVVNGQRHVMSPGQVSPEGYRLVSTAQDSARLSFKGREVTYRLGREVSSYQPVVNKSVSIRKSGEHYYTTGSINGYPVRFVVDTGATMVAISEPLAKRLGIDYRSDGAETTVVVPSGRARAWTVEFKNVKVGEISVSGVAGAVLEGTQPDPALLGMSYLKNTRMSEGSGSVLRLEVKY